MNHFVQHLEQNVNWNKVFEIEGDERLDVQIEKEDDEELW